MKEFVLKEMEKKLGITLADPDIRTGADMQSVMYTQNGCKPDPDFVCYEMYRDQFATKADQTWLREHGLRYDVTVIFPKVICSEYNKTKGHYHPICSMGLTYPELYEVISGKAIYLLQKVDLSHVIAIYANAGEAVLIPPDYGHVTINPSTTETLVMANIVSSKFSSIYSDYEERSGAAYYYLSNGTFVKNSAYPESISEIQTINTCDMKTPAVLPKTEIYSVIGSEFTAFFNDPDIYRKELGGVF
jgi:glucose-6-phosphate isomerase